MSELAIAAVFFGTGALVAGLWVWFLHAITADWQAELEEWQANIERRRERLYDRQAKRLLAELTAEAQRLEREHGIEY